MLSPKALLSIQSYLLRDLLKQVEYARAHLFWPTQTRELWSLLWRHMDCAILVIILIISAFLDKGVF